MLRSTFIRAGFARLAGRGRHSLALKLGGLAEWTSAKSYIVGEISVDDHAVLNIPRRWPNHRVIGGEVGRWPTRFLTCWSPGEVYKRETDLGKPTDPMMLYVDVDLSFQIIVIGRYVRFQGNKNAETPDAMLITMRPNAMFLSHQGLPDDPTGFLTLGSIFGLGDLPPWSRARSRSCADPARSWDTRGEPVDWCDPSRWLGRGRAPWGCRPPDGPGECE